MNKYCEICKLSGTEECKNPKPLTKCKHYNSLRRDSSRRRQYKKELEELKISNGLYKCRNPKCTNIHDGSYASGMFCSNKCYRQYLANCSKNSLKHKAHIKRLHDDGIVGNPIAPFGTWKCVECDIVFKTKSELRKHNNEKHGYIAFVGDVYICPYCSKEFKGRKQLYGHMTSCPRHPNKEKHDAAHKRTGETLREMIRTGKLDKPFKGKHHTNDSRKKMRISTCDYLKENNPTPCRYNRKSIPILESIAKEHGWNIQHAENGGEFYTGIGYWLDAYDKDKNIALEFDERVHYEDVYNNVLRPKDIERQNNIIEHLHCEFWRYNSTTGVLWKVT